MHDPLNRPLLLQVPDGHPRETPVDLEPLDEDALADEAEGRDLLQDTVIGSLVEDDGVLRLVLDLALGPLLLLGSLATAGGCGCCCLSLGLCVKRRDPSVSVRVSSKAADCHPCQPNVSTPRKRVSRAR